MTMTRTIDQFVPELFPGDATAQHTIGVQRALDGVGIGGTIHTDVIDPSLAARLGDRCRPVSAWAGGPVLYQFSVGSPLADVLNASSAPLAIDYHNLTPAEFAEVWDPPIVHGARWGRQQLAALAPRTSLALADSAYNAAELRAVGYDRVEVAPILLDPADFSSGASPARIDALRSAGPTVLFVGRIVPNKAQHQLVLMLAVLRRRWPTARLWLIGAASAGRYAEALTATVNALGLSDAVEVTGKVDAAELAARFAAADVFASASEHEGFCVPVIEAMHHGLPVVAAGLAAVGDTVGSGGLVTPTNDPTLLATAVDRVLTDVALRASLIDSGRLRAEHFDTTRTAPHLAHLLSHWLDQVAVPQ